MASALGSGWPLRLQRGEGPGSDTWPSHRLGLFLPPAAWALTTPCRAEQRPGHAQHFTHAHPPSAGAVGRWKACVSQLWACGEAVLLGHTFPLPWLPVLHPFALSSLEMQPIPLEMAAATSGWGCPMGQGTDCSCVDSEGTLSGKCVWGESKTNSWSAFSYHCLLPLRNKPVIEPSSSGDRRTVPCPWCRPASWSSRKGPRRETH